MPKSHQDKQRIVLSLRLAPRYVADLDRLAVRLGETRSYALRHAMRVGLDTLNVQATERGR